MKKHLLTLLLSFVICQLTFSQPNSMTANTATTFTLNTPCGPVMDGIYTVQLNYFSFAIGDWVPGPDNLSYTSYTNVQVTRNLTTGDVLYNFSTATPVPNFPSDMAESQGWIKVPSAGISMNWDNHQLNCPALPVHLINFSAGKSGCNVNFNIQTADEYDMLYYVIERNSTVGSSVLNMPITYLTPYNDNLGHTYTFTDSYPLNGINYYRLRMVGLSGYVKYSNIISVNASGCTATHPLVNCGNITIQGPSSICTRTGDYSLSNNPSYTVNNWGWYSNDLYATLSPNYGPTTKVVRPNWDPEGTVELRSFRTGCTVGTQYSYKLITMGKGTFSGYYAPNYDPWTQHTLYRETWGDNILGHGNYNVVRLENPPPLTQTWELLQDYSESGQPITWSRTQFGDVIINMPTWGYGWIFFRVTWPTTCGTAEYYFDFWTDDSYRLTPNPAISELIISAPGKANPGKPVPGKLRNKTLFSNTIRQVLIVDRSGRVVMQKSYGTDTKQVNINTSSLKPDFYIARIFDGKTWKVMKFIKQ